MHYLIYKTTNKLNNKFYVGKHKTKNLDDGYLGSGILLEQAIAKYGKENFVRETLFELSSEEEMNSKESEIVDADFVAREDTYNLALGGANADHITDDHRRKAVRSLMDHWNTDEVFRKALSEKRAINMRLRNAKYGFDKLKGRPFSEETRRRMSVSGKGKHSGEKNGVYGTHWVTDGTINMMVKKPSIPDGFRKGRTL
jgi:hypothetical protein